jgi:hypothetical protein
MALLRRHLIEKDPVSTICDEIAPAPPSSTGGWKQHSENSAAATGTASSDPERLT